MARNVRLMPGQTFAGDFVVERLLGQGTMGAVYLARQTSTGTQRALKLMNAELVGDAKAASLFELEARIGGTIGSPHVVEVVAAGVDEATKLPWLAMEYLEGKDLERWLADHPSPSPAEIRRITEPLFEAIARAHAARVVHRDLKPENVFIVEGKEGSPANMRVKVLDFGVAKIVTGMTLAGTGSGLGTPVWTAPEQGGSGKLVRSPADVWALGLIVFRLLAGKVYWRSVANERSSAVEVAMEILRAPLVSASQRAAELGVTGRFPEGFDAWFSRCVVRDPDARFADAAQAWAALVPMLDAMEGRGRRGPRAWILAGIVLVVIAVVALALAFARR